MATTIVEPCPSLPLHFRWKRSLRDLLAIFYRSYVEDMGNRDKCTDVENSEYYEGRIDLAREVIAGLTGKWLP